MVRRLATAAVAVGALIAVGAWVANAQLNPSAPLANASSSVITNLLSSGNGSNSPGKSGRTGTQGNAPGRFGFGGFGLRRGGRGGGGSFGPGWGGAGAVYGFGTVGRGLTVKSVSGNTITATGRGGQSITVQVTATTAYTEAGAGAALSDIQSGSIIAVKGTRAGTSPTTINATAVEILLPTVAGVVTNVNGSTVTMTGFDGASHTVNLTGATRYKKAGATATSSDVATGVALAVQGSLNGDGSITAVLVTIRVPSVAGQVTSVQGTSYTITGRFGSTVTVNATSTTTYISPNGSQVAASTVVSGTYILAQGTLSADGKTLTAQRIVVVPMNGGFAEYGRGFGGGFGFRHRHGFGGDGAGIGGSGMGFGNGGGNDNAPGTVAPGANAPGTTTTTF